MDHLPENLRSRLRDATPGGHPDAELLQAFSERRATHAERTELLRHLARCAECAQVVALLTEDVPAPPMAMAWRGWAAIAAATAAALAGVLWIALPRRPPAPAPVRIAMVRPVPPVPMPAPVTKPRSLPPQTEAQQVAPPSAAAAPAPSVAMSGKLVADAPQLSPLPAAAAPPAPPPLPKSLAPLATASVAGNVTDANGAAIPGAQVRLTSSQQGSVVTTTSMVDGSFAVQSLPPGTYTVEVQKLGFNSFRETPVTVAAATDTNLPVKLAAAASTQTVEVTGEAPLIQPQNANITSASAAASIANLPEPPAATPLGGGGFGGAGGGRGRAAGRAGSANPSVVPVAQWRLSPAGGLERRFDAAAAWQPFAGPGGGVYRTVASVRNEVWLGGDGAQLWHSSDSGATWTHVLPGDGVTTLSGDITHIEIVDAQTLSVETGAGARWTSDDGGRTWRQP